MTTRRAKIAATATVLGLGGLGGIALGTNPGASNATQQVGGGNPTTAIVTGASGASAAPTSQTVALHRSTPRAPIVTRASGGGPIGGASRDD
jgi:hypothetical protein